MPAPPATPLTVKDAIDLNSGRFEFLKQTLTLGSAGIAAIAALFTDTARIPSDLLSKWVIFVAGLALAVVIYNSVMGLSVYANVLIATAEEAAGGTPSRPASMFVLSLRNHARGVVIGLFAVFVSLGIFASYRLFFLPTTTTAETAIESAASLISKEMKQPVDSLYLSRVETDNDAFLVTFLVGATNSEATVRLAKKDGSLIRLNQDKKVSPSAGKQP
jgi:hypothetical protein